MQRFSVGLTEWLGCFWQADYAVIKFSFHLVPHQVSTLISIHTTLEIASTMELIIKDCLYNGVNKHGFPLQWK